MYGSDYPFGETTIEVRRITAAGLTESQLDSVFYANAKGLFYP
jgi:predicted TIM-barrel fold metal-dependent hydrolase